MSIDEILKCLKEDLNPERYEHSLGVAEMARELAERFACDPEKAYVAGLLHDCAKCIPNAKKLKICNQQHIPVSEVEKKSPYLLHARLGAYIAKEKYNVTDPEILSAIEFHTTGKPEMTMLEKIIFIADYIEPMRSKAANLPEIRKLAFQDIDRAVFETMRDTIQYLNEEKTCLDNQTVVAYNYYKKLIEEKEAE